MVRSRSEAVVESIITIILVLLALTMVVPFVYLLAISFSNTSSFISGQFVLWPEAFSLRAYEFVLSGRGFLDALQSSLFITLVGVPLSLMSSAMLAYALSKRLLPFRKPMIFLVVFTMLFSPGLIPNYLVMDQLGLLNSWWAIILPGVIQAWNILVMKSFFESIPDDLEESAKIDGCNELQIFFRIMLPLSKAMLAAFTLFIAVFYWNQFFGAIIYLNSPEKWPLQVFLQQMVLLSNMQELTGNGSQLQSTLTTSPEIIKAATVIIVTMPIMVVYPFLQKHFAKGVMIGSVKG
jgi:putative aldouronate transport system permease protein